MRYSFLPVLLLAGWAVGPALLPAQTSHVTVAVQGSGSGKNPMIGFLSQRDQDRIIGAHDKALAAHPRLKLEEEALTQAGPGMRDASAKEQMAFLEKVRTHEQKVRQAMLKVDPTLGPLFDEIDRHYSQVRAEQEQAAENTGAASGAPASKGGAAP